MRFFEGFPWSDKQSLNLDWLLKTMQELLRQFTEFKAVNTLTYGGIWDITKNYPAWTIVTTKNSGYISLQPVPVGVPLTNRDYWIEAVELDPRIAALISQVAEIENEIATLKQNAVEIYASAEDMAAAVQAVGRVVATKADGGVLVWDIATEAGAISVQCGNLFANARIVEPFPISGVKNTGEIGDIINSVFSAGVKLVQLPGNADCTISESVRIPNGGVIDGNNAIVTMVGDSSFYFAVTDTARIHDLTMNCKEHTGGYAILAHNATNITVENVTVNSPANIGIGFSQSTNCKCLHCTVDGARNFKPGFWCNHVDGVGSGHIFDGCVAKNNTLDGFIINSSRVSLFECVAESNGKPRPEGGALGSCGIYNDDKTSDSAGENIKIVNCRCFDSGESGINIKGRNIEISGCECYDNALEGIKIRDGSVTVIITSCQCYENGRYKGDENPNVWLKSGIAFFGVFDLILSNNICRNLGYANTQTFGIEKVTGDATNVCCVGNITRYNKTDGKNFGSGYPQNPITNLEEAGNLW